MAIIAVGWRLLTEQGEDSSPQRCLPAAGQGSWGAAEGFIFRNIIQLLYKYNFHLPTRLALTLTRAGDENTG